MGSTMSKTNVTDLGRGRDGRDNQLETDIQFNPEHAHLFCDIKPMKVTLNQWHITSLGDDELRVRQRARLQCDGPMLLVMVVAQQSLEDFHPVEVQPILVVAQHALHVQVVDPTKNHQMTMLHMARRPTHHGPTMIQMSTTHLPMLIHLARRPTHHRGPTMLQLSTMHLPMMIHLDRRPTHHRGPTMIHLSTEHLPMMIHLAHHPTHHAVPMSHLPNERLVEAPEHDVGIGLWNVQLQDGLEERRTVALSNAMRMHHVAIDAGDEDLVACALDAALDPLHRWCPVASSPGPKSVEACEP